MRLRQMAFVLLLVTLLVGSGCSFKRQADAQFGDQNFKTTIALIELYKTRYRHYPETLRDLTFTGSWDALALGAVEYKPIGSGYELNIERGWIGQPALSYPPEFWRGLGLVSSNVAGAPHTTGI